MPLASDLHHDSQLQFTEQRLDRENDSGLAADHNAPANLERLLTAEMPGRNDLLAAAKLVAIAEDRHLKTSKTSNSQPCRSGPHRRPRHEGGDGSRSPSPWGDAPIDVIHEEAGLRQGHGLRGVGRLA